MVESVPLTLSGREIGEVYDKDENTADASGFSGEYEK